MKTKMRVKAQKVEKNQPAVNIQKVIEDHEALINRFAFRYLAKFRSVKIFHFDAEDLRQELKFIITDKISKFDPKRGNKPITYIYRAMEYGMNNKLSVLMNERRIMNRISGSLESDKYQNDDGSSCTVGDTVEFDVNHGTDTKAIYNDFIQDFLDRKCTIKERIIIKARMEFASMNDAAKSLGVSNSHMSAVLGKVAPKYKKFLEEAR